LIKTVTILAPSGDIETICMSFSRDYHSLADLPSEINLFPLANALLLPACYLPLNIFEPRYLDMIDNAMSTNRMIGMVQPRDGAEVDPALYNTGCAGRVVAYQETADNRMLITLLGVARFNIGTELDSSASYRTAQPDFTAFADDLVEESGDHIDRERLLSIFREFLRFHELETDWESIEDSSTSFLINNLAMNSPYGAAEKQALLEAPDLKTRCDTLIAITQMSLTRDAGSADAPGLQ
jgi:hypothetical protein